MTVEVVTFGCRLNTHESEAIRQAATKAGRQDLVIVNSCAVTAEAVKQVRQTIRRLARENPGRSIAVTGCAAQTEPETFAAMPEVLQVIGNAAKTEMATWEARPEGPDAQSRFLPATEPVRVNDIMALRENAPQMIDAIEGRARAIVQVQNGCDHRCTFCIIPYARGNARSSPMGAVVEQVKRLVGNGYREIVLTGVDITSYGQDLPGTPRLGRLLQTIMRHVPDLERLRLSSIDSIEADCDLMDLIAGEPRLMPHLHLSLQAGDDLILKRMKRRHSRDDAIRFCEEARRLRPGIVFGADIIAGFPTETEAMLQSSLRLIEDCGLTHLHVFPYSPRRGTPAARMPQVPQSEIRDRARRLREAGALRLRQHLDRQVGRSLLVLAERGGVGRAEDFTPVRLPPESPPGAMHRLAITGHDGHKLLTA
ncbi:MAG: tRNA (N(6)-L-threonylcarbamoyladenosine(37)-C(2))-methylthiotransferase MtaB [Methylocystis sp.]|nr:tRNA (N(6)-L-threonylcarbamoyladenosine(37)-C(2))-methylthiotransferase MtaB [Methylocystis sp.]MCA3584309.1 tRNA (N(6)-L-threonylcarbamoyladenosine(37)-C(2))-methylthiotransferase MtaB [Methylocystis sp.]MCA3589324.1 tRNA (N(6)-L-threonylcarbamoyladenosine(37)-C(2))-methylthiotransferase MtaB [Methylocystis sp.]MCA3592844.1 tRNA (N(6)-L-threonylcarbamoyladenosine(37)-C(2))-methylthiotransferase MtaB [Methylocystis sp.]